jgi:hypothetical protein
MRVQKLSCGLGNSLSSIKLGSEETGFIKVFTRFVVKTHLFEHRTSIANKIRISSVAARSAKT